jgi:hypothetical protein
MPDGCRYILDMPADHILVLAVDGLRASALGAYGNTSFPTPTLDRLGAESFLLDSCFAGSTGLPSIYRSLWRSEHPLRPSGNDADRPALARLLSQSGYASTLITDEPELQSQSGAAEFDRCVEVAGSPSARADDVSETSLARLFAAACDAIDETAAAASDRPQLVWIHSRGMYGPWDAPLELQASLLDEGDPPPYEPIDPPDFSVADTDDPDTAFVCGCAYAAQVMVLDACVEALLTAAHEAWPEGRWLLTLLGIRGYPLGEHKQLGGVDERLFVEQLHVPFLLRMSDGAGRLARSGELTTHADLLPTLLARIEGGGQVEKFDGMDLGPLVSDPRAPWRDAMLSVSAGGARAMRTADWCLRSRSAAERPTNAGSDDATPEFELYVRPDDRWEINDIAALCHEVVESLAGVVHERAQHIEEGRPMSPQWLPRPESESTV